jgi:RNA-directed DNA polymerase
MNEIPLEDFFQAYFDCRKSKRNSLNALDFELDFEEEVIELYEDINKGAYEISPLDVFIVNRPVKREIFAAQFRDRVIHHLVVNKLNSLFEKEFIYDSYSCRENKGTLFGIKRIKHFIASCSNSYKDDCWILKADIKGYFMSIDKDILINKLVNFIEKNYQESDKNRVVWLCKKIINNNPIENCFLKSPCYKWRGLPKSKSLFCSRARCGLPIGNYTNQIFANFYLNSFDHFIKSVLRIKYYGRYVDDFIIISKDKNLIRLILPKVEIFLLKELKLHIHPRKIYFQHCSKGVNFLGSYIKPWRIYSSKRVKNNFWEKIDYLNMILKKNKLTEDDKIYIRSSINSYLGMLNHFQTYRLRKKFLNQLDSGFWNIFEKGDNLEKIFIKR